MENIFEGAIFGDKYITSDGRTALYIGYSNNYRQHKLIVKMLYEDKLLDTATDLIWCASNGQSVGEGSNEGEDIIGCIENLDN